MRGLLARTSSVFQTSSRRLRSDHCPSRTRRRNFTDLIAEALIHWLLDRATHSPWTGIRVVSLSSFYAR